MLEPKGFDIRYSTLDDLSSLQSWFVDPNERDPFPFSTDMETDNALRNWIGFSRIHASLTGVVDGVPCAIGTLFLMPYRKTRHTCAFYLIVDPAYRRKGIGASMVRNLMHLAKTRFHLEGMHAEIFEPSPLRSILEKQGFSLYARQEGFVQTGECQRARLLMGTFFV